MTISKRTGLFLIIGIFFPMLLWAGSKPPKEKISANIDPAVRYLYEKVDQPNAGKDFKPGQINALIRFVADNNKKDDVLLYPGKGVVDGTSAYYEIEIDLPLDRIMAYIYNPDIPKYIFNPLIIRYTRWEKAPADFDIFNSHDHHSRSSPVIVQGIKHVCTTPHPKIGGYFEYDTRELRIGYFQDDQPIYIDISKMTDTSGPAHKGGSIGPADNWLFYYLDEKGLNKRFLGWVDAYIYTNVSLTVFVGQGDTTRIGLFKWIKAGWAGINFAGRRRIHEGLKQYGLNLRKILTDATIPDPQTLAKKIIKLDNLPEAKQREQITSIFEKTRKILGEGIMFKNDRFRDVYRNGEYIQNLSEVEIKAILAKDYLKFHLKS